MLEGMNVSFNDLKWASADEASTEENTVENDENTSTDESVQDQDKASSDNDDKSSDNKDETESKDEAESGSEKETVDKDEPVKKQSRLQKRFKHFTTTISQKDAEILRLRDELKNVKKQYGLVDDDGYPVEPNPKAFQDERSYRDAYLKWDNTVKQMKGDKDTVERLAFENKAKKFQAHIAAERLKWADYDEVVTDEFLNLPAEAHVQTALMEMPNGADVLYALAKDPDLFIQINSLPLGQALLALGQISTQMDSYVAKLKDKGKVNKTKKVPAKVKTSGASVTKDPDKMTMDEYVKYRREQRQNE